MVTADQVTAVLVTRGDVDMGPVEDSLPFRDFRNVVVWDNSQRDDVAVYGRYASLYSALCGCDIVFVQDDDVILPSDSIQALLAAYEPGQVVCNMPQRFRDTGFYDAHSLVGFGAVFDARLPHRAFMQFAGTIGKYWLLQSDPLFQRTCDVVFTALTPRVLVDVPYGDREFASDPNRMWRQPDHVAERQRMLELALSVRDRAAA